MKSHVGPSVEHWSGIVIGRNDTKRLSVGRAGMGVALTAIKMRPNWMRELMARKAMSNFLTHQRQNAAGGIFTAKVLVLLTLGFTSNAQAQNLCQALFKPPVRTAVNNDSIGANFFTVNRTLPLYSYLCPFSKTESLQRIVEQLPAESTWVDMGAGEARALIDGLKANPRIAEGVAISFKRPAEALSGSDVPGRFRYLDGDFVENMALDGKLDSLKGKTDLITDIYGPLSYSEQLPPLLQLYLDLLRPNGTIVFNMMSERNFDLTTDGARKLMPEPLPINQFVRNGRTEQEGVASWLRTIPGIEVIEVGSRLTSGGMYWEQPLAIKVRKISPKVVVPDTLRTIKYTASMPPTRVFEIESAL